MFANKNRYFIELQLTEGEDLSRRQETLARRFQAEQFLEKMSTWLHKRDLEEKVASAAITAMGQVQITCEKDIVQLMAEDPAMNIANVRSSAQLAQAVQRLGGAS